jgi:hypothetical protein
MELLECKQSCGPLVDVRLPGRVDCAGVEVR